MPAKELRTKDYKKRATVVQCSVCRCILSRDVNAAMNILNVFEYQMEAKSSKAPPYLRKKPLEDTTGEHSPDALS